MSFVTVTISLDVCISCTYVCTYVSTCLSSLQQGLESFVTINQVHKFVMVGQYISTFFMYMRTYICT